MIDMELTSTERARDLMHKQIGKSNKLTDSDVVKASQDLDKKILEDMLKQDPKIENRYLKGVIKSKDIEISRLQNEVLIKEQKIRDMVELIVMQYESGLPLDRLIRVAQIKAVKEGII